MAMKIKRRMSGAGGAPGSLYSGQFAWNFTDQILYFGDGDDGAGNATSIKSIAGSGAMVALTGAQTIAGAKTFSTVPIVGTMTTADNSTSAASTAFVKAQGYLTGNQSVTLTGDITGSGATSIATTLATVNSNVGTFPKVTVNAKGLVTAATALVAGDIPSLTHTVISDFDTQVRTSRLDQMAAPTASVSFNSQKITNLLDPGSAQDAATKQYVDNVAAGLSCKTSVLCATTANLSSLSALQTIDGYTLIAGDRILVKDQTASANNGVYVAAAGAWARSTDMNAWTQIPSAYVWVEVGTVNHDTGWVVTSDPGGTLGTTPIAWAQFASAPTLPNVGSPGTYTKVTTDAQGRVTTGANPTTLAGYGITDAQGLNSRLTEISSPTSTPATGYSGFFYLTPSLSPAWANLNDTVWRSGLFVQTTYAGIRSTMGLDTMATQNAGSVAITGGTISGVTIDDGTF